MTPDVTPRDPNRKWLPHRGRGEAMQWIRDHLSYRGDACLVWPFYRDHDGYGTFGHEGRLYRAHRMMCELVNGPPPTPRHETAHSCGKGHEGCVHPLHLSWKTNSDNQRDRRRHGTAATNTQGNKSRLTKQQHEEIRQLKGRMTRELIAETYGISLRMVTLIQKADPNKVYKLRSFEDHEDELIIRAFADGKHPSEIAPDLNRTVGSVWGRIHRLRAKGRIVSVGA